MSFVQDLNDGLKIEDEFVAYLETQGVTAHRNTAKHVVEKRLYDVFTLAGVLYEIKYDKMWKETRNIYIEDKAINRSRADYIVYKLKGDKRWFVSNRELLMELLNSPRAKKTKGGDRKEEGSLVSTTFFRGFCETWG